MTLLVRPVCILLINYFKPSSLDFIQTDSLLALISLWSSFFVGLTLILRRTDLFLDRPRQYVIKVNFPLFLMLRLALTLMFVADYVTVLLFHGTVRVFTIIIAILLGFTVAEDGARVSLLNEFGCTQFTTVMLRDFWRNWTCILFLVVLLRSRILIRALINRWRRLQIRKHLKKKADELLIDLVCVVLGDLGELRDCALTLAIQERHSASGTWRERGAVLAWTIVAGGAIVLNRFRVSDMLILILQTLPAQHAI